MPYFDDAVVLVTGGTSGMGSSHVRAYAAHGARVVIGGRNEEAGLALAREIGERATFRSLDVTDEAAWQRAVTDAEDHFGPITILISNAGIQNPAALVENTDLQVWQQVLAVNVTGHFLAIKHVAPSLRRAGGGSIVTIGSAMSYGGSAFFAPYVASKWALRGMTKSAALELGRDNIRVNAVHPGVVSTPLINQPTVPGQPSIAESYSPDLFAVPRLAQPEEISNALRYLTSPEAAFATGTELLIDGGLLLGPALQ
ncbi:SDR family NAD(P)-dependent oxidoreductase [Mycobacterium stomatepiae]|uniref:3-alpha-hydroxysteroid dehydrogenase n=1 Tax=Mycobacterium stomatepiae TaxID=470076 RepID=A0A7I7Q996_9MYCO|nr:SDR family oxidoreductase [Mycobacterium stomatepiae]MCV7164474.1 SDR family oxidoreductase [Mycobacterium stomatepiae]BBY22894.1 3-alpha-hydroxysteroid dehydrogenase [Mycobacterium stomatepiae]